jgi:hypothetical protein
MKLLLQGLKWVGITLGIAILSMIGFFIAAWLSPGDPGRSYLVAGLALLAASMTWRLLTSRSGE